MDQFDIQLLGVLQARVPLVREPFAHIADELDRSEKDVLAAIASLRNRGVIREISGIFDAAALGYSKALVAFRMPADKLDAAGSIASRHPGISHCYGRSGSYNLWFTLAVSPSSKLGLAATAQLLAEKCLAESHLLLPSVKQYKLRMQLFDSEDETTFQKPVDETRQNQGESTRQVPSPSTGQLRAIRALQIDLPNSSDPFASLGESAEMDPDMLLVHAADFISAGWLRRYSAAVAHKKVGFESNVMVAWEVSPDSADVAGCKCAQLAAVSHCYLRPAGPDWPYTLYTMIHGHDEQKCKTTIDKIAAAASLTNRTQLQTLKEYKKQRIRLFDTSECEWENQNAGTI